MRRLAILLAVSLGAILSANACLAHRRSMSVQAIELTPEVAKQALLEMMRSEGGKALGFFEATLVEEMSKINLEKQKDGSYHWTGAYRFDPTKATYVLFVSLGNPPRPPLRPHPNGYLLHLGVYEGSFEMKGARWVATVPRYKYALLD